MAETNPAGFRREPEVDLFPELAPGPRFLTGVQQGWHAIDAAPFPGCGQHAGALCGAIVRVAAERFQPYNPAGIPVSYDCCPQCRWTVAAATGEFDAALRDLGHPLAIAAATAFLDRSGRLEQGTDDPGTIALLAHIARHAPVALVAEGCAEGDCEHVAGGGEPGTCPESLACRACSVQSGAWAGEWEGQYCSECVIEAPCAVLLALAKSAGGHPPEVLVTVSRDDLLTVLDRWTGNITGEGVLDAWNRLSAAAEPGLPGAVRHQGPIAGAGPVAEDSAEPDGDLRAAP